MKIILEKEFYHEGRGPELIRVHYRNQGSIIEAIDFYNPDDVYDQACLKHLQFIGSQAFCFTPEEEYSQGFPSVDWREFGKAAAINLEKSDWYKSFTSLFGTRWRKQTETNIEEADEALEKLQELRGRTTDESLINKIDRDIDKLTYANNYYQWLMQLIKVVESGEIFKFVPKN